MSGPRKPVLHLKNLPTDEELLHAAGKVKRPYIFTRGAGPKDISASPGDDKKSGPSLSG